MVLDNMKWPHICSNVDLPVYCVIDKINKNKYYRLQSEKSRQMPGTVKSELLSCDDRITKK